jgi:hypothetical protein
MTQVSYTRERLRLEIRSLVNNREMAYRICLNRGVRVPDIELKMAAIKSLRQQLAASQDWSFDSHVLWISAMRHQVACLLPSSMHTNPRMQKYRTHIIRLMNWCDQQKQNAKHNLKEYVYE